MLDGRDIQPRAITDEISQYLDSDTVSDELEAAKEEREEKLSEIEVDPISDTEEQEDELEDKPGDAIEVVIEDRPEDIPEERPLPTSEYGRPCSPSLPPTFCNPVWGPRPSTGSNPPTQTHYWVEGFDPKPNPDWVGSGLGLGFTGSCGRLSASASVDLGAVYHKYEAIAYVLDALLPLLGAI
ncbi:hypothetical protein Pdw03_0038 [Penicillium digitatum]|uniref:Uncharacterized protein n=1 Tax=Penicillium digitatum TaxID=36651 RepID=A0A7T7BME3_PENDI|nr:hypothetical protein Pdw03_0038 [Penicillium digitatum]